MYESAQRAITYTGADNLGATEVQHSADQLEASLHRGMRGESLIAAIRSTDLVLGHLMLILKGLPGLVAAPPPEQQTGMGDAERARAVLQEIAELLAQDDASALDFWEANAALLRALHADAAQVEAAIADFDFDTALDLLQGLDLQ